MIAKSDFITPGEVLGMVLGEGKLIWRKSDEWLVENNQPDKEILISGDGRAPLWRLTTTAVKLKPESIRRGKAQHGLINIGWGRLFLYGHPAEEKAGDKDNQPG